MLLLANQVHCAHNARTRDQCVAGHSFEEQNVKHAQQLFSMALPDYVRSGAYAGGNPIVGHAAVDDRDGAVDDADDSDGGATVVRNLPDDDDSGVRQQARAIINATTPLDALTSFLTMMSKVINALYHVELTESNRVEELVPVCV